MKLYKFMAVCTRTGRDEEGDTLETISRDFDNAELCAIRDALKPDIRNKVSCMVYKRILRHKDRRIVYPVRCEPGAPGLMVWEDSEKVATALAGVLMSLGIDYKVSVTELDSISNVKSAKEREKEEEEKDAFFG